MPTEAGIRWFKEQFQDEIADAVKGTPFSVDMLTAIACQETGYIWNTLRKKMGTADVLRLCVGDTLDAPSRSAFPRTRADLVAAPNGQKMFDIAHAALVEMAEHIGGYKNVAKKPDKFCHGFGVFQYDLQFFKEDPQYFLQQRYTGFGASLGKAIGELKSKLQRIGWGAKTSLTDYEMACVAIAYNTGRFKPEKKLKQGYKSGGRYYGEAVHDFILLSKSVTV
jgi:hypothetical protein